MKTKYTYTIKWSDENEVYICRVDQFPSLGTHGDTAKEALQEMITVLELIERGISQ